MLLAITAGVTSTPQCPQGRQHRRATDRCITGFHAGRIGAGVAKEAWSFTIGGAVAGNRALALGGLLVSTGALAMDSNIHIAFPLGTNQVTSDDVRIVQSPPTQVEVPSGFKAGLRFGVNIKGYVGVEFDIDAQGWDLFKEERGGLGFVGGGLRLHPVQIAQHWKPVLKEREWDLSLAYLTGWHLLGQQADGGWAVRGVVQPV